MVEVLNITMLMGYLHGAINKVADHRKPSPNTQYSIFDAAFWPWKRVPSLILSNPKFNSIFISYGLRFC
jgi:hypothetical protein